MVQFEAFDDGRLEKIYIRLGSEFLLIEVESAYDETVLTVPILNQFI